MNNYLTDNGYIPLDKSWTIRMGVLDLMRGYDDTIKFLEKQKDLGEDLQALYRVSKNWRTTKQVDVGESGTIYRFLQYISWHQGLEKKFIKRGTLRKRKICNDRDIINRPLESLATLDNGTSQWMSAAILCGNTEKLRKEPYHVKMTRKAKAHYEKRRANNKCWDLRYDQTLLKQAKAIIEKYAGGKTSWVPVQAEDYCLARVFNLITPEEGKKRWPSLISHETNRLKEMEKESVNYRALRPIESKDHRVVQAFLSIGAIEGSGMGAKHPKCVNKTWPQFPTFLKDLDELAKHQ